MAKCQKCNGKGHHPCPHCKGKGLITDFMFPSSKCKNCGGSGSVKCNVCDGKGQTK